MRTLLFVVTVAVTTVYYAAIVIGAALSRRRIPPGGLYDRVARNWSRRVLWAAGTSVEVRYAERVPDGPVIFVSNHASFFDVWALQATIDRPLRFVAKKELTRIPVFGAAFRAAGHIVIDRKNRQAAFAAYDAAGERIRSGVSAVVFPEGTRSRTGDLQPFKKGPFVLAIAARVPIVPVYVANSFDIMPKGRFNIRPQPLIIHYGDPISTEGLTYRDRDALAVRVRDRLLRMKAHVDGGITHD